MATFPLKHHKDDNVIRYFCLRKGSQINAFYAMPTLKDLTLEILKNISPSASLEEIMYKINLAAQVMEGMKDADEGKIISTEELLEKVDSWAK